MIDINEAVKRLQLHEGLRLQPYFCTKGKQTIGIGRNLDANPITEEEAKVVGDWLHGITIEGAKYLLRNDIRKTIEACKKELPFFAKLDDERQYALVDMAFNLGINGLLKFKKMLAFMWIGDYSSAAGECLKSRYAQETKSRAQRIAHLIRYGIWKI